ncbi:putative pentatricopeptide repeat-containing protein At1g17630 [Ipomoea triloba]|uniref:putative pentatricopeptide repeat-containing protein At1g17630 n=1 Tax=Ipomoea triloba TaxID=35885 RepID=UPI00125DA575|nr:putative pentatricopeptide repeat-containing protein At1g17630 [Ipomoea triloba]
MIHGCFLASRHRITLPSVLTLQRSFTSYNPSLNTGLSLVRPILYSSAQNELHGFFDNLLQQLNACAEQIKQIHSQIILTGASNSGFLVARLISAYSGFGLLDEARKVFETSLVECFSNLLFWNSILRANVTHGEFLEAVKIYAKMRLFWIWPDAFGFPLIVRACGMLGDYNLCKVVHCHVIQMGFQNHLHTVNELLSMYGKVGRMDIAHILFDKMSTRTHLSWNIIISGFSRNFDCDGARQMFSRMESEGWQPNPVTWTSLLSSYAKCRRHEDFWGLYIQMKRIGVEITAEALAALISVCATMNIPDKGEMIHEYVIKGGFENHSIVINSLISLYGKNGGVKAAEHLFSGLDSRSIVSWNSLISSYAESGLCDEAFAIFSQLEKLGEHSMIRPNVVSWSAVIGAFAAKGRHKESLELFQRMQFAGVMANSVTISSVLSVCADISALRLGREIHGFIIKVLRDHVDLLVGNGLINMYMKCGSLKDGKIVFDSVEERDLFSWNMMISGYGMHGHGDCALETFDQMIKAGFKPDEVSMVAILSACGHAGLVSQGRKLFDQMRTRFGIEPQVEHYACMVDLLGRAGLMQEAHDMVQNMPMKPNACVWGALLNSCRMHKNTEVAEKAAAEILNLDSEMTGSYMLLCNLYAGCRRWDESANVRVSAKTKGLKKIAGHSWIEVKKKVYMFSAGKALQTGMEEIHWMLSVLSYQMDKEEQKI